MRLSDSVDNSVIITDSDGSSYSHFNSLVYLKYNPDFNERLIWYCPTTKWNKSDVINVLNKICDE
uniref:Uncharacterized protein n=1 Tax=Nesodiprion zhejiangensis nucleopolyhedrovirus TaxID=3135970 RepID=A0AAN0N7R7_9BACU